MVQQLNDTIAGLLRDEWLQKNTKMEIKKWDTILGSLK